MLLHKICTITMIGLMLVATASADLIPYSERHRTYRSSIEMTIQQAPKGIILIYLTPLKRLIGIALAKNTLKITQPGTIFAIKENKFKTPFHYNMDTFIELHSLKDVDIAEIPSDSNHQPEPAKFNCVVTEKETGTYGLACETVSSAR